MINKFINSRNIELREAKGVIPFWVIAERLGVHENTLRNWMKAELQEHEKQKILSVINEIKDELKVAE